MKPTVAACAVLLTFQPSFVQSAESENASKGGTLIEKIEGFPKDASLASLLVDSSAGSVSAAGLAGVDTEVLSVIENVRDFSLLLNVLDKNSQAVGVAITPARTTSPFPRITLDEYANSKYAFFNRLLASVTLSYAQGKAEINSTNFTRTAYAIATSAYFDPDDDPVVAIAKAKKCGRAALAEIDDRVGLPTANDADRAVLEAKAQLGDIEAAKMLAIMDDEAAKAAAARKALEEKAKQGDKEAAKELKDSEIADAKAARVNAEAEKAALDAFNTCATAILEEHGKKWNRSRFSISYAAGSVKPTDGGGSSVKLGKTAALNVLYGFDGVPTLKDSAALTLTARRSIDEPVLDTLGTADVKFKSTTLYAARLAGGSSIFRGIAEVSNSNESSQDVTFLQRTFRRALGIDYRVAKGVWLNLRYGKQRKVDGDGDEDASLLTLNWSPSALLQGR